MFYASRLTVARQRVGLTKKELALRVGVDARAISGFEAGEYVPTDENLIRISQTLEFPRDFFEGDEIELLDTHAVSFRSLSRMTARQRNAAVSAGSIAFLLSDWVDKEFELPPPDLPDFGGATPEAAALSLRQDWALGERPIKNMIHLLEAKGIRVFSLAENCVEVDAYSVWRGVRPFVFLNMGKSGERRRFDAAHELGHLVLHSHASPNGLEAEKEAHAFASAFLMPTASMKAIGRIVPTLDYVIRLKKIWGVSAAAMAVRLHELALLTYYHYNRLFVELSRKGFRTNEPMGIKPEASQIWQKVFAALRREGRGPNQLANELSLPVNELVKLVFGLVTVGLQVNMGVTTTTTRAVGLRLVR